MNTVSVIPYSRIPPLAALLGKALISRKPGLKDVESLERIDRIVSGAKISPDTLAAFRDLCNFNSADGIPLPFFYVLAQRLQLVMLTDPRFPLGIAGLVHISNSFRQYRQAGLSDSFDMRCHVGGDSMVPAGREFEIVTEFLIDARTAVECRSRFLSRKRGRTPRNKPGTPSVPLEGRRIPLRLPADAGRRYAKVSGDYNPIHLYGWTARLFGFRRPIVQGIYLLSLALSRLEETGSHSCRELSVEYKLPVYLPAEVDVIYRWSEAASSCRFEVRSGADEKLHGKGSLSV